MKQLVFLSYDLGIHGDYSSLYKWLDEHGASECGDSFCKFRYEFKSVTEDASNEDTHKMIVELGSDIKSAVNISGTDRLYMVSEMFYNGQKKIIGTFIYGRRKQSNPWDGASNKEDYPQILDE